MAHEIATTFDGRYAMAYVGDTPWHGLGQKLDETSTIEQWAIAAGLDYELAMAPVTNGDIFVPNKKIIYRTDKREGLSVVGDKYQVVQPVEVLDFFKRYVGGFAQLETAGVLHGGRRYWAMARLDGEINVAGDITKPYLLLASSCDGSLTTQARLTTVRVVCNNTMQMASRGTADVSIRHNSQFNAEEVGNKLEAIHTSLSAQADMLKSLASIKLSEDKAKAFVGKLYGTEADKLNRAGARILELFNGQGIGAELESSKGTAYGLLQATTQFMDWEQGRSRDNRLLNSWFGAGADFKTTVANDLMALAAA